MKIFLSYIVDSAQAQDDYLSLLPVGLVSIAAFLENLNYDVVLANFAGKNIKKAVEEIIAEKPDVLGVSLFTHNRGSSLELLDVIKKTSEGIVTVVGGPHADHLAESLLAKVTSIDFLIKGEGELAFQQLLEKLEHKNQFFSKIISAPRFKKLDEIPAVSTFSLKTIGINKREQFSYIISSRGCAYNCAYCNSPQFWKCNVGFRSAENLVDEIEFLYKNYGIIYFSIRDDNFTFSKKRVLAFCCELKKRKIYIMWNCQSRVNNIDKEMLLAMKSVGLEHIQFGIESGSEKILKAYDKKISLQQMKKAAQITREVGVLLSIYIMVGMFGESEHDILATRQIIKELRPLDVIVSPVAYYPGTKIYEDAKIEGKISDDCWFSDLSEGIYLRPNDQKVKKWLELILREVENQKPQNLYYKKDYLAQQKVCGDNCWLTSLMYADYLFDLGKYDQAKKIYFSLKTKFSGNVWPILRLAEIYFETGAFSLAKKELENAKSLIPENIDILFQLIDVQLQLGEINLAKKILLTIQKKEKNDKRIVEYLEILSNI